LALLRADDHHHRYLESLLSAHFDLALVVIEPDREKVAALRRRGQYREWAHHLYHRYLRVLTGENRYRRRYFAHDPRLWAAPGPRRIEVRSVNDDVVVDALSAVAVDVVVSIGCSCLSEDTLAAAGPLVINIHRGFLGDGCDGRLGRVGSIIHRVAPGADTGDLVEVVRPPTHGNEAREHLRCRADLLAIHRLAGWLDILERGGELPSYSQTHSHDQGVPHVVRAT
jgi:methionyl-tRNA formyltransferase